MGATPQNINTVSHVLGIRAVDIEKCQEFKRKKKTKRGSKVNVKAEHTYSKSGYQSVNTNFFFDLF